MPSNPKLPENDEDVNFISVEHGARNLLKLKILSNTVLFSFVLILLLSFLNSIGY